MLVLGYQVLADGSAPLSQYLGGAVDTATIAAAISAFIPIAVAFVTKQKASDAVKAIANLLGVALAAVVALYVNGSDVPVTWQVVASTFIAGLITSITAYKGAWKPLLIAPKIAAATKNFGIGTPVPAVTETARPASGGVQE